MTTENEDRLYVERNLQELEPHYSKHVNAMTAEALDAKYAIAAELAWRDQEIEKLRGQLEDYKNPKPGNFKDGEYRLWGKSE